MIGLLLVYVALIPMWLPDRPGGDRRPTVGGGQAAASGGVFR